jgi:hypothetical protein
MVERAGAPMPPERGDPRVCRAWPGVGTTFSNPLNTVQQLVEQRIPSVVDDGGGFNGVDNVRENPLSGRIGDLPRGFGTGLPGPTEAFR